MPKASKKVYAVLVGRGGPKIYNTWDECNEQVFRYPGATHKSFPTQRQAKEWLERSLETLKNVPTANAINSEMNTTGDFLPPRRLEPTSTFPRAWRDTNKSGCPQISLSSEQRKALDQVKQGHSLFFTGSAGTGKSVLLREIIRSAREAGKNVAITASTGIAAVNIGGSTLHSWAGVGLGEQDALRYIGKFFSPKFANVLERWQNVDILVIDEISMIDGVLFDKLECIARGLRKSNVVFGGIQLVLSGDFFQLPPVSRKNNNGVEMDPYFAFQAESWNSCVGTPSILTHVFRQKDQAFIEILNAIRFGRIDARTASVLHGLSRTVTYHDGIEPTELYPTRSEVQIANNSRLNQLKTPSYDYLANDRGGVDVNGNTVRKEQVQRILERLAVSRMIKLKIGAQVMLVKNLVQGELVNGTLGQVVGFSTISGALKDKIRVATATDRKPIIGDSNVWPVVHFVGVGERLCIPQEFTVDNADGSPEAMRDQVPLILAWALSVHKSQGQTLQRVKVDLRRTFEMGQAYVALSRATCLEHLQILGFDPNKVKAHPRVSAWHFGYKRDVLEIFDSDGEMESDLDSESSAESCHVGQFMISHSW